MAKTWKEGLYLGTELPDDHPRVKAGVPLHGANLMPGDDVLPDFRRTVLEYIDQVTRLGHRVLEAIAGSLGLAPDYFASRYTANPLILFRIFPSVASALIDGTFSVFTRIVALAPETDSGILGWR